MVYVCSKPECGTLVAGGGKHITKCPRCSTKVETIRVDSLQVDYNLMPMREVDDFDWSRLQSGEITHYKMETAVKGSGIQGKDKVILFVPAKGQRSKTELWVVDPPFKPFFFISAADQMNRPDVGKVCEKVGAVVDFERGAIGVGDGRQTLVCLEFPNDIMRREASRELYKLGVLVYDASISLERRITSELSLSVKELPTRLFFDIETEPSDTSGSYDILFCKSRILIIHAWDQDDKEWDFILEEETDEAERKMLTDFFKLAFQYSACIGYNSRKFDAPYTQARAELLNIAWKWKLVNAMDMYSMYDYITSRGEEGRKLDLDTVGMKEFGIGKLPLGPNDDYNILIEWYRNDRESLKAYCRRDVETLVKLDKKYNAVETRRVATGLVFVNPDTYLTYGMGVESLIRYELSRLEPRMVVRSNLQKQKYAGTYGGAIVMTPAEGMWDWVMVLDFKSIIGTEPIVLLEPNGMIRVVPIGTFVDRFVGEYVTSSCAVDISKYAYKALSFDGNGKTVFSLIRQVSKHRAKEVVMLKTLSGSTRNNASGKPARSVTMTPDHSVFIYKNGVVRYNRVGELDIDSKIVVPTNVQLPVRYNHDEVIDLLDVLKYLGKDSNWVSAGEIVRMRRKKSGFKRYLLLKDLASFLGYYVAEGDTTFKFRLPQNRNKHRIQYEEIKCLCSKVFTSVYEYEFPDGNNRCFYKSGESVTKMISDILGCGSYSYEKRVPWLIFISDRETKIQFLRSYLLGDGMPDTKNAIIGKCDASSILCYSKSKMLLNDLSLLLYSLGVKAVRITGDGYLYATGDIPELNIIASRKRDNVLYAEGRQYGDLGIDDVHSIEKKAYDGYVYDLGVDGTNAFIGGTGFICLHNSMYNRIMQAWNIGPDTLDVGGDIATPDIYKDGEFYAPGARYSIDHKSSFARALEKLEKYRQETQKQMEPFAPHSDEWTKLDKVQYMYKVNLLAFYGVTGNKESDMYTESIAASITAVGRRCLENAKKKIEELGYQAIYGDTDSIFVPCMQYIGDLEKTLEFGKGLCDEISKYVSEYWMKESHIQNLKLEVNVDKVFTRLLLPKVKKRYVGWMLWQGGLVNPEYQCQCCSQWTKASDVLHVPEADIGKFLSEAKTMEGVWNSIKDELALCPKCSGPLGPKPKLHLYIAGFETKRRDWTVYAKNMQRKVFEMTLDDVPKSDVVKWLRSYVREMYEKKHDAELSFSKPLRKDLDQYKANAPHIRAARQIQKMTGITPLRGTYITYYVLNEKGLLEPILKSTQKVQLPREAYDYIFKHQVAGILDRLGFQEFDLDLISGQARMDEWSRLT